MFNWKILDSEATIKFLQKEGLEDTIRKFVSTDLITVPAKYAELITDTDKMLSKLPADMKPEVDRVKAQIRRDYKEDKYREDLFYVLGRKLHGMAMNFQEHSGMESAFITMLKNPESRAFLGERLRESAADLRCAYMRAVKNFCINAAEERKNSEKEAVGVVIIITIAVSK